MTLKSSRTLLLLAARVQHVHTHHDPRVLVLKVLEVLRTALAAKDNIFLPFPMYAYDPDGGTFSFGF